jgi:hypothetical protein
VPSRQGDSGSDNAKLLLAMPGLRLTKRGMHRRLWRGARYLLPLDLVTPRYVPPLSPTWPDLFLDWGRQTGSGNGVVLWISLNPLEGKEQPLGG